MEALFKRLYTYLFFAICFILLHSDMYLHAQEPVSNFPKISSQPDSSIAHYTIEDVKRLAGWNKDSALIIINAQLATNLGKNYNDWLYEYYAVLGEMNIDTGDYEEGKKLSLQALLQSRQTSNIAFNSIRAMSNLGNVYSYLSDFEEATKYYYSAVVTAENTPGAINYVSTTYNNMATALLSMKEHKPALNYLKKAAAINLRLKKYRNLSSIYNNIAVVYGQQLRYDSGIYYAQKALNIARTYKLAQSEVTALLNLGAYYGELHQPETAISYLLDIYKIKKNVNPYYRDIQTPIQLGSAYTQLKKYDVAEKYYNQSLAEINRLNNLEFKKEIHEYLANFYDTIRDYKKAYFHHKELMRYSDSMLNEEKTGAVARFEVQYRSLQKDKDLMAQQILIQEQEHKISSKNLFIILSIAGIIVLSSLLVGLIQRYRHRQRLQDQQIQVLQKDQQIGNLKAVMHGEEKERTRIARELHDGVGGTLAAVKMNFMAVQRNFSFLNESEDFLEGMGMLDTMSNELRQAAHNLMPEMIIQHGLAESVSRYCEQIRKGRSLPIELQLYGNFNDLNQHFTVSVYRIIQELIHNIVKHAQATHAIVQLSCHEHLLSVVVEDDGVGFEPEKKATGLGLKNLRSRVDSLNGHLTIESIRNRGTTIYLEFDLNSLQKTMTA